mmetsp:Transcript_56778/g.133033  ORF Transcript_56778/g.133033 Transcript_56778/m.133033 type:complete len:492 (+) Transcript_56778:143-1618(+)
MPFQTFLSNADPPAYDSFQAHLRNVTLRLTHAMDPHRPLRPGDVPLRSRDADLDAALDLYEQLDSPQLSLNAIALSSMGLDPELEWAWKKLGFRFEEKEDGDSPSSSDSESVRGKTRDETDRQLHESALHYNAAVREIAELTDDEAWRQMKSDHAARHDQVVRKECLHLTRAKRFRLVLLHPSSDTYQMVLLSSLAVQPQQAEQRSRMQELIQDMQQSSLQNMAEHIIDNGIDAFVPNYDPQELESWTSHLDIVTRCGIHQTRCEIQSAILQLEPGRKQRQLERALEQMRIDVLRSRRSVPSRSAPSTRRHGMVMRRPRTRLRIEPRKTSDTPVPQARSETEDPVAPSPLPHSPSPIDKRLLSWLSTIYKDGVAWQGRALVAERTTCAAILHLDAQLPAYNIRALLASLPSLDVSHSPVKCLAIGRPPTSTLFLCRSLRHARALKASIRSDLLQGSIELPLCTIAATSDIHHLRSETTGQTADTAPWGPTS